MNAHAASGLGDVWPGDLLAYRQEWDAFIAAHVAIWRYMNSLFEAVDAAKQCPAGIYTDADIATLSPTMRSFCASLVLTRMRIDESNTTYGIPAQWNAWANRSSAEVVLAAADMLSWHQGVVQRVAGQYAQELLAIASYWKITIKLPDLPPLSTQAQVIGNIEGAYVAAKGILQIAGYNSARTLAWVGSQAQATAEGLSDTVKAATSAAANPWTWIGIAGVVSIVAAGVFVVYVPPDRIRALLPMPKRRKPARAA